MQRVKSSAVAISLLLAGLYILYLEIFVNPIARGHTLFVGVLVAFIGAAWLFSNFIAPMLRQHRSE
jgi:hypothetical protein